MILLPAIDLMSGEVVRLRRGEADQKTVYSRDPAAFAQRWEAEGGDYLHVVDLDAAFTGEQRNLDSVRAICAAVKFPVELGGGIRDVAAAERAIEAGVSRVIIGTRAAEALAFVSQLAAKVGSGGVSSVADVKRLSQMPGLYGCIIGKALYDGTLNLRDLKP